MKVYDVVAEGPRAQRQVCRRKHLEQGPERRDLLFFVLLSGIVAATAIEVVCAQVSLRRPLDADLHAWASSSVSLIARSYAQQGILALRGLQIANNPPLGREPDIYTHWPPLFPLILSRLFLVLGESESVSRGFALVVSFGCVIGAFALAKSVSGTRAALGAAYGFLCTPAFFIFSGLITGTMLGVLFGIVALLGFIRGTDRDNPQRTWRMAGLIALCLAVFSSWEALLITPGLVAAAVFRRDKQQFRLAAAYVVAGGLSVAAVIYLYLAAAPHMGYELWQTILYRAGSAYAAGEAAKSLPLHAIPNLLYYKQKLSLLQTVSVYGSYAASLLGAAPILMLLAGLFPAFSDRKNDRQWTAIVGAASMWVLWFVIMHNQVVDNNFQMLLAVPLVALCVGIAFVRIHDAIRDHLPNGALPLRAAAMAGISICLLWPVLSWSRSRWAEPAPTGWVQYSRDVERSTPPNAVVMMPPSSLLPVYYSHRHILRSAHDDEAVALLLGKVDDVFPGSPVFLALPPQNLGNWKESVNRFLVFTQSPYVVLLFVGDAGDGRMATAASLVEAGSVNRNASGGN